jgi:hypothetical protein
VEVEVEVQMEIEIEVEVKSRKKMDGSGGFYGSNFGSTCSSNFGSYTKFTKVVSLHARFILQSNKTISVCVPKPCAQAAHPNSTLLEPLGADDRDVLPLADRHAFQSVDRGTVPHLHDQ